jgi:hypothetical protein
MVHRSSRLTRRDFMQVGSIPLLGLGLSTMGAVPVLGSEQAKAKSCVLIWLDGGPSHLETFDPKPQAPVEVRGPFKSIATSVPGLSISEVMPHTARIANKVCIVRSVTSPLGEHNIANHYLLTGYQPTPALAYPSYGAVVSHLRDQTAKLPAYIALNEYRSTAGAGFLGASYEPYLVPRDPKSNSLAPKDLTFYPGLDEQRLLRRRQFLEQLDRQDRSLNAAPDTAKPSSALDQAYRMTLNRDTRSAFQLDLESAQMHERYGDRLLGQCCLLARRLVEQGVSFINIHNNDWDTHADLVLRLKEGYAGAKVGVGLIPTLDQAVSALIEDLDERGLLESTLVVVMGEFGRTPKINSTGGRDHWPRVFSVMMAGGGLKQGYVHGASDRTGESPMEAAVTPADLACTIYSLLGISAETTMTTSDGRPIRVNQAGKIIRELIA